jgi:glyoxylase-like metal-dependent hydrolase (beta-lactamase superfamily II)
VGGRCAIACLIVWFGAGWSGAQPPRAESLERGTLPASWVTGGACPETPAFRVHEYNPDFFILRQSGCTNFEKPFLYLLFGEAGAMLVDTGAKQADVAGAVGQVMERWSARRGGRSISLVVVHSHGHGDHIAGDAQFKGRDNTTVVEASPAALAAFFGLHGWPESSASYSLSGRIVDVIPIPGHEPASIAIYDRRTGVLLTGDTLYPGRLYVRDGPAFAASIQRLVAFTRETPVSHILGAHVENTRTPYVDYPEGTTYQPDEHALELGRAHLLELDDALAAMRGTVVRRAFRDFTIWPLARPAGP